MSKETLHMKQELLATYLAQKNLSRLSSKPCLHPTSQGLSDSGTGCRQTCHRGPAIPHTRSCCIQYTQKCNMRLNTLACSLTPGKKKHAQAASFSTVVLLLHGTHLRPNVTTLDGWMNLGNVLANSRIG